MGHEALKIELIEWLTKLEDSETIDYLKIVKDSSSSNKDWWHDLTDKQKASIERGLRDIDEGKVISHKEVKNKYGL